MARMQNRKESTRAKLDRERVLPFYLSKEQIALYDQDEYKYLIHLLKIFPSDEFHILQYLLLKFHPLILRVCRKYYAKKINLDWTDLISFARYSFIELVMRFNLDSTLYFKTYIPLALDRANNDFFIYDLRRRALLNAVRLDHIPSLERDSFIQEHSDLLNHDNQESEYNGSDLQDYKDECLHFVEKHKELTQEDKSIFLEHFLQHRDLVEVAKEKHLPLEVVRRKLGIVLQEVKEHLKDNFL